MWVLKFKRRNLVALADLVVGNEREDGQTYFLYRSSSRISEFFDDLGTGHVHDGSTRNQWVADVLEEILSQPVEAGESLPEDFSRLIEQLMDPAEALNEGADRINALAQLNTVLNREGLEAFFHDERCFVRKRGSHRVPAKLSNPHRPFSAEDISRRKKLEDYLQQCNEDQLIGNVLIPLFRQLGFQRIMEAGHTDKALEYGKDVWMRFVLPTQHVLYFGVQAKRNKIDSSGKSKAGSGNVAEIYHQALMMLAHEIFDPELNRRVLVDHAFIVSGGEITKAARNWLGGVLDASKRSQIIFMDRDDILNLYTVTNTPLPEKANNRGDGLAPF